MPTITQLLTRIRTYNAEVGIYEPADLETRLNGLKGKEPIALFLQDLKRFTSKTKPIVTAINLLKSNPSLTSNPDLLLAAVDLLESNETFLDSFLALGGDLGVQWIKQKLPKFDDKVLKTVENLRVAEPKKDAENLQLVEQT